MKNNSLIYVLACAVVFSLASMGIAACGSSSTPATPTPSSSDSPVSADSSSTPASSTPSASDSSVSTDSSSAPATSAPSPSDSPASADSSSAPATSAPSASESPAIEDLLPPDELAKFRSLPIEFQEALLYDPTHIRRELRDLPDEIYPMEEILPPDAFRKFEELSPRYRQFFLIAGYEEAFKERPGQDPATIPPPSEVLAHMVDVAHRMEF